MDYIHIVNGDSAGGVMQQALAQAGRTERVVVLRDDLAIGPVRDIDDDVQARAGFWQRIAPELGIDFAAALTQELDTFLLWRCRELHAAGQLALRGDSTDLRACELKRE